jgi:purine nucleosidase
MSTRMRVISDNDYCGDPDGLVQLAHLLLSPSVDVRAVIGSHLREGDSYNEGDTGTRSRAAADVIVEHADPNDRPPTYAGSNTPLPDRLTPVRSAGVDAIVEEAMIDSDRPLFVTLGGGLTELASAYLEEPRIADRLIAVWIGGPEYPGVVVPPPGPEGAEVSEYNLKIDIAAAQVVFDSPIQLWQVPRDAYRQVLVSFPELEVRMRPHGPLGRHLVTELARVHDELARFGVAASEAYVLGDSPLVLLTALQCTYGPDPSSSRYATRPAPRIRDDGTYEENPVGRPIRVYDQLDVRLMMEDLFAKLVLHARGPGQG